ncbi:Insulin-like growth factor binding protein, N-terminal [Pseudocohnilembus persalinus]|uniref:Insulin-like growth factor binding protein, N-terminal n=1 Tax=Pseudocohnilembus persalinus TaxID=266149 RepID=A0A0V0R6G5_PSEPJ|nr:Insulin-like growth factor binding protein, N-terminal [Pseudocohnilembus persalinus]|eukprot:KRX09952.1 Insulin-like growth factor binding protein, N-terminal [Pseudocohnilembus persalinus]
MSSKLRQLVHKIKISFFYWIISYFSLILSIQLDTTQWQEVDINSSFIIQNFIQYSGDGISYDSLQLSQRSYASLIRSFNNNGQIFIQVLDEFGNTQCSKSISVEYYRKYILANTNVEGEFFFAYTSKVGSIREVFFGFLDETCNFSRGLLAPEQLDNLINASFYNLLAKTGKDNIYIVTQTNSPPFYLYLIIMDISDINTYLIKKHEKLGVISFRWNLFSIQAFYDDYAIILAKNDNDKLQMIKIDDNGNEVWNDPIHQGVFLNLNQNDNYIQNKAIQIENTNKYSIVTGDREQNILIIYTFQYNGNGKIQDICLKSHLNQFGNVGNQFFRALEFGVINPDFIWIKGDNNNENKKTVIFFANPLNCQIYRNPDDGIIYKYQLEHLGMSHIFHSYYNNQTVSFIVSSSQIDGNDEQNLQAIRIIIGDCPQYCEICSDITTCYSCISSNGQRDVTNLCYCKNGYYQDTRSDDCLGCPQYCQTCTDSNTCQSCIVSDGERDISNLCICKDGYYQDTGSSDCIECPYYCSTCSDSSTCQTCIISDGERDVLNLCHCQNGYYQDGESDNCLKCPLYCSACSDQNTCQSCIITDGERDLYNKCQCKDGYYQEEGQIECQMSFLLLNMFGFKQL